MAFGKTFLAVLVLILSQALVAMAQTPPATRPANGLQTQLQKLTEALDGLNLTDAQKGQVKDIMANFRQQMSDLRPTLKDLTPQERMAKITGLLKDLRQQLAGVLDPDQQKELAKVFGGAAGGGSMLDRFKSAVAKLDLTADQKTDIAELFKTNEAQIRALMEKRKQGEDIKGDMQQLLQDMRSKLQSILTPEQAEQLKDLLQADKPTTRPTADAVPAN